MITHLSAFSGEGGKTSRFDASRAYAVPLTTAVPYDYTVDVDLSTYGPFAAVSLNGRLWLFQDGNSIDLVALQWKKSEGKMTFAESLHFDGQGDVVLARGLDWILTNNNIFMVADKKPYIKQTALFDEAITDTFLYSVLRHSSVPLSGIDPFTQQAWGKRDDNGNSSGNAQFSKDTHLLYPAGTHTFEQCYSLLPAVGDWIIFENFIIRRPDNPLTEHFDYMLNVRPLIPLELSDDSSSFGSYDFSHRGIQLAYLNGKLWGRGLRHIGRAFLLPNTFDINGNAQGYYVYIAQDVPDLNSTFSETNSWMDVALSSIGDNLTVAFHSDVPRPITGGACIASSDTSILDTSKKNPVWQSLSQDNGRLFFDYPNQTALLLDDKGAQVFKKSITPALNYKCPTLRQWLAPADYVEAVDDTGVIASIDRHTFFSNFQLFFLRNDLTPCQLPLSAAAYEDKEGKSFRLSAAARPQGIDFKHSVSDSSLTDSINWEDVYRNPISMEFINAIEIPSEVIDYADGNVWFYLPTQDNIMHNEQGYSCFWLPLYYRRTKFTVLTANDPDTGEAESIEVDYAAWHVTCVMYDEYGRTGSVLSCTATCSFIDPDNGELQSFDLTLKCNPRRDVRTYTTINGEKYGWESIYHEYPESVICIGDKIGFIVRVYDKELDYQKAVFYPVQNIPDNLRRWIDYYTYGTKGWNYPDEDQLPVNFNHLPLRSPVEASTLFLFKDNLSISEIPYTFWGYKYTVNAYLDAVSDNWTFIAKTVAHSVPFALHFSPHEDLLHSMSELVINANLIKRPVLSIPYYYYDPIELIYNFAMPDNRSSFLTDDEETLYANDISIVLIFCIGSYAKDKDIEGYYSSGEPHYFALTVHVHYDKLILDHDEEGVFL